MPRGQPPAQRGGAARAARRLAGGTTQLVLLVVALFWLLPTVGLLLSSLRGPLDIQSSGWWTLLTEPARLTLHNYTNLLDDPAITRSLVNSLLITVPATLLVVVIGSLAGYVLVNGVMAGALK